MYYIILYLYYIILYYFILYYIILYYIILYYIILYYIILYYIILYYIILYYIILYYLKTHALARLTTYVNNSMQRRPHSETATHPACQVIIQSLRNKNVHHRVQHSPSPRYTRTSSIPFKPTHSISRTSVLILFSHLSLGLPSGVCPYFSPIKATEETSALSYMSNRLPPPPSNSIKNFSSRSHK